MKIGVVFPQTEIGEDPAVIRDYAQAGEAMGYTHILAFDSVVGANPDRPGGWGSQYDYPHAFHEPLVLFGFLAGGPRRIELVTGILPLPVQRPIPVWMGGESPVVLRRAARLADGWITLQTFRPGPAAQQTIDGLHAHVREAGRDPAAFGIEGRVALAKLPSDEWAKEMAAWRAMRGITHLCVNTMGLGLPGPEEHVRTLERFRTEVGAIG